MKALGSRPEHADKSMSWFLAEAHRRVLALHGLWQDASARACSGSRCGEDRRRSRAQATGDAVPQTLAHLPAIDNGPRK